jgi:hypothetical protein
MLICMHLLEPALFLCNVAPKLFKARLGKLIIITLCVGEILLCLSLFFSVDIMSSGARLCREIIKEDFGLFTAVMACLYIYSKQPV